MYFRLVLVVGLSMLDAFLTLIHIGLGLVEEGNPLMALILATTGAAGFFLAKMTMTIAAVLYLWAQRHYALARAASVVALVGYVALTMWHSRIVALW